MPPRTLVLTGTPCAGKSTAAAALATTDVDDPEDILRRIHAAMEAWRDVDGVTVLDNSSLTIEQTVAALVEIRDRPSAPPGR